MNPHRPLTVFMAIVLLILLSLFGLALVLPSQPPLLIGLYVFLVLGVGSLLAAFGLWKLKRWGLLLTLGIAAQGILVAGSGLWLASSTLGKVVSTLLALSFALMLVLVALPVTRKAFTAARTPAARA